jgi:tetratricopeptide (TPR) repeat protein
MRKYIKFVSLCFALCLLLASISVAVAADRDLLYYIKQISACRAAGDYKGGLANANKAVQLDPKDASLYAVRAHFKSKTGDTAGALKDVAESLKIDPKYTLAYEIRATILLNQQKWQPALKDGDKIVALEPKESVGYYVRGWAKLGLRDIEGAVSEVRKAVALDPESQQTKEVAVSASHLLLARAKRKSSEGNVQGAIKDCNDAISMNPKNTEAVKLRNSLKAGKH